MGVVEAVGKIYNNITYGLAYFYFVIGNWLVWFVFYLFIIAVWYYTGVFTGETFSNLFNTDKWTAAQWEFWFWLLPFISLTIFPFRFAYNKLTIPRAYTTRIIHPIYFTIAMIMIYLLFFFRGGAIHSKLLMNLLGFNLGYPGLREVVPPGSLVDIFFLFIYPFILLFLWWGSLDGQREWDI